MRRRVPRSVRPESRCARAGERRAGGRPAGQRRAIACRAGAACQGRAARNCSAAPPAVATRRPDGKVAWRAGASARAQAFVSAKRVALIERAATSSLAVFPRHTLLMRRQLDVAAMGLDKFLVQLGTVQAGTENTPVTGPVMPKGRRLSAAVGEAPPAPSYSPGSRPPGLGGQLPFGCFAWAEPYRDARSHFPRATSTNQPFFLPVPRHV